MKSEIQLIAAWEILMGAAAAVLSAIEADRVSKPTDVLGWMEKARSESAAATAEISKIIEERRAR